MSQEQNKPKVTKDQPRNPYLELLLGFGVPIGIATKLDRRLTLADKRARSMRAARRLDAFKAIRAAGRQALIAAGAGL